MFFFVNENDPIVRQQYRQLVRGQGLRQCRLTSCSLIGLKTSHHVSKTLRHGSDSLSDWLDSLSHSTGHALALCLEIFYQYTIDILINSSYNTIVIDSGQLVLC